MPVSLHSCASVHMPMSSLLRVYVIPVYKQQTPSTHWCTLLLQKSKCRKWFISFEAVPWYSSFPSFPSSKPVICFSSEHSSAVLFHPCLAVMRNRHQLRALSSLHMPGELLLWAHTALIFPVQPSIRSRDWNLSVSACHLATSMSKDGVLKCQRSALLHQHLLMG